MCINCKLTAMMDDRPNPNPQKDRVYPTGWDLSGWESPEPFGARIGAEGDDTLRMVFADLGNALMCMTLAEAFSGAKMEFFYDGKHYCYRPAIMKRNKPQPPAWHVVKFPEGEPEVDEMTEIQARQDMRALLESLGLDPNEMGLGDMEDPDGD